MFEEHRSTVSLSSWISSCLLARGVGDRAGEVVWRFCSTRCWNYEVGFSWVYVACVAGVERGRGYWTLFPRYHVTHISTTIYYKDTDTHTYLHHQPSHPSHCKKGLPHSQLLRLRRLCSEDSDFLEKGGEMVSLTWIRPRLFTERSPGHPTVRPGWCTKQSQPL